MTDPTDMSTPVTRGELREELGHLEHKFDHKLELWGGMLLARIESMLIARIDASEQRLLAELARHTRAIQESMTGQISVIDEKYADLPGRVSWLELAAGKPP